MKLSTKISVLALALGATMSQAAFAAGDVWDSANPWGTSTLTEFAGWNVFNTYPTDNTPEVAGSGVASAGPANVLAQIRSAGVKVIQLEEGHTPAHVAQNIRTIGLALNVHEAEKLAKLYEAAWQNAQANLSALKGNPRVLFVLDHTGKNPQASGNNTAANAVIQLAHAKNVMADQFNGYRPLTAESIVAAAPEVIITTTEAIKAAGGIDAFLNKPGLHLTPAGKAKKVVSFDSLLLLGFTPRLPELVENLAQALRKP